MKHLARRLLRRALPFAATLLCPTIALANPVLANVDGEFEMSASDVEDPFPDRGEQTRPHEVWVPGTLSLGLAGASVVMGRLALRPDCGSQDDVTTCAVPSGGDIGVRGGRVFGAAGFGIGAAAFGVVTGRQLGHWLSEHPGMSFERKRQVAVRTGTTAIVIGGAGMIAGATLLGVGTRQAISIGEEFEGVDTTVLTQAQADRLDVGLGKVKIARAGLMMLVATPTLVATGIALLVNRPQSERVSVAPALSPRHAGLSLQGRF